MYKSIKKTFMFLRLLLVLIIVFSTTLWAQEIITNRTGAIEITMPDGAVLFIGKDDRLPDIPSGSIVKVLDGSVDIVPAEGFIQVVVGDSVATVEAGDRVTAFIDEETGMADFRVEAGKTSVITGNTAVTIGTGQDVQIWLDKTTGATEVRSVKGVIETITVGVKTSIPEGAAAKINADAKTRTVHVESEDGYLNIISVNGEFIRLARGESIDTPGSAVGEIQTFAEEAVEAPVPLAEEPVEPEKPEGSGYRP